MHRSIVMNKDVWPSVAVDYRPGSAPNDLPLRRGGRWSAAGRDRRAALLGHLEPWCGGAAAVAAPFGVAGARGVPWLPLSRRTLSEITCSGAARPAQQASRYIASARARRSIAWPPEPAPAPGRQSDAVSSDEPGHESDARSNVVDEPSAGDSASGPGDDECEAADGRDE